MTDLSPEAAAADVCDKGGRGRETASKSCQFVP
jgi:hypothetical protein